MSGIIMSGRTRHGARPAPPGARATPRPRLTDAAPLQDAGRVIRRCLAQAATLMLAACASPLMTAGRYETIAWFGHSGGGTLAVLLARRFSQTRLVVTVAGDLDTAAWAKAVAREDLDGSLNPADGPPLAPEIRQRHYAGA